MDQKHTISLAREPLRRHLSFPRVEHLSRHLSLLFGMFKKHLSDVELIIYLLFFERRLPGYVVSKVVKESHVQADR